MRRTSRRHLAREEVLEPRTAIDEIARRHPQPIGERLVDEEESAIAVDGVEAGRRMIEEIGELHLLVADDLLHLVTRRDVLEGPESIARTPREEMRGKAEPRGRAIGVTQREAAIGAAVMGGLMAQPRELRRGRLVVGEAALDRVERRAGEIGEEA